MSHSIFISYSNNDLNVTKTIVDYLEHNGYKCFVSYRDIPVGKVWSKAITEAIEECKVMVALYSEYYNQSEQVDREIELCCDVEKKPVITFMLSDVQMCGAKKYFLKNLNWISAAGNIQDSLPALLETVRQNIGQTPNATDSQMAQREDKVRSDALSSIRLDSEKFNCYIGRNVSPEMIYQAVGIDGCVYSNEYQGVYETCINWWKKNPAIYVMIEDNQTKKIVGYINAMPLNNDYYQKIRSGETIDTDIPSEEIETYDFPDTYQLYFSSIAIHPDYHNTNAFKALFDGFIIHILELYDREIYFSSIVADAVSAIGEKLCKYIGLTHITNSNHGSKIYEGTLIPPSILPKTNLCKRLITVYQQIARDRNDFEGG
jgi:hypothetical protein